MESPVTFAPKILSGVDVIDKAWGGFYRGGAYMVYGRADSGRNLMTLVFTQTGVLYEDVSMFITPDRPKDLMIQAASIGFNMRQATESNQVRLMRIPPLINLQNMGDEGVARAMRDLIGIVKQIQPARLVINDFMPFVMFRSFDRFRSEFIQMLEQIDSVDTTLVLVMSEPANPQSRRVIDFMSSQMTGAVHIESAEDDASSTKRRLTLIPHIGHITRQVVDYWDLADVVESTTEIAQSLQRLKAANMVLPGKTQAALPAPSMPRVPGLESMKGPFPETPVTATLPPYVARQDTPVETTQRPPASPTPELPIAPMATQAAFLPPPAVSSTQQAPVTPTMAPYSAPEGPVQSTPPVSRPAPPQRVALTPAPPVKKVTDVPAPPVRRTAPPIGDRPWNKPPARVALTPEQPLVPASTPPPVTPTPSVATTPPRIPLTPDAYPWMQDEAAPPKRPARLPLTPGTPEATAPTLPPLYQPTVEDAPAPQQPVHPAFQPTTARPVAPVQGGQPLPHEQAPWMQPAAPQVPAAAGGKRPTKGFSMENRGAFREKLQQHFLQHSVNHTPFLLIAMRMDTSQNQEARPFDFEFILDIVTESLGNQDDVLVEMDKERLIVLLANSRSEGASHFFGRLKKWLQREAPQQADHLLNAVSAIVVPDGRPFGNAEEFLTYVLDDA